MKTYFVFVTFKQDAASGAYRVRYIDSQWADESHARSRKDELSDSLSMFDVPDWLITIKTGTVADAGISGGAPLSESRPHLTPDEGPKAEGLTEKKPENSNA